MSKCVLFVEGQSEQIFVRELLLHRFNWDASQLAIRCYMLNAESLESAEYDYGEDDATHFFQLIDAHGDIKVVSAIKARAPRMVKAGFDMIVGLRDMYSRAYREMSPNSVSVELNQEFIDMAQEGIDKAGLSEHVRIHFAIMEVETWMLALLEKWKGDVSMDDIKQFFDPEADIEKVFHPYIVMKGITSMMGDPYEKHKDQVNAIMAKINWEDYEELYESGRCPSFNAFLDTIKANCE